MNDSTSEDLLNLVALNFQLDKITTCHLILTNVILIRFSIFGDAVVSHDSEKLAHFLTNIKKLN